MRGPREVKVDFSAARGRRLLIALSGGADSVALTVLLARAREEYGLTLFAAHLDHGIRPESGEDAEFCRALCENLEIPFRCWHMDIPAEAARLRAGIEAVARAHRHAWLEQCRVETGADFIVLAHHMDDQAETVLMHLGRGAGPRGACGMRTLSGVLYRPLLDFRKAELVAFLRENGYQWREDSTNTVDDNPRNAIRLHVMPELEKSYPQFARAVARFAQSAQIESDYLDGMTREYLSRNHGGGPFCRWIDLTVPPPRALLRRAIQAACPAEELDWEQLNALEALCGKARGKIDLSPRWFTERVGHRLYFVPKPLPPVATVALSLDGETVCPPLCVISAAPAPPVPIRDDPWRQVLNAQTLEGAVVRTRREGDRIRPLGGGDKLLSDYFIDKKIDRPMRDAVALVAVGNRVHWVAGLGISQEAAVKPGDRAVKLIYHDYE